MRISDWSSDVCSSDLAGSLAVLLRRKERIEDAAEDLGRYPAAGIGNREHDVIARRHFGIFAGIELVEILVRGLDRETTPVRHGVELVDGKIGERRFYLRRIGDRDPELVRQHHLDLDLLAERAPQQASSAGDQIVEEIGRASCRERVCQYV